MAQVEQRCGARAAFPAYVILPDRQRPANVHEMKMKVTKHSSGRRTATISVVEEDRKTVAGCPGKGDLCLVNVFFRAW